MIIRKATNIQDDKLSNGLKEVLTIIDQVENRADNEYIIDFSHTSFVSPSFILPLMVFVKGSDKNIKLTNITPYMNLLYFGDGLLQIKCEKQNL